MIADPYALIKELADELEAVLQSKSVRQIPSSQSFSLVTKARHFLQTHQNQK
jgi:hypothetical protein